MSYEEKVALNRQSRSMGRGINEDQHSDPPVANMIAYHKDLFQFIPKPGWIGYTAGDMSRSATSRKSFANPKQHPFGGRSDMRGGFLPDAFYNAWIDVSDTVAAPILKTASAVI